MKARIILLAAIAVMFCSCENILSDTFIDLEEQELVFPAAGDITTLQFTPNTSWTAASDQVSWCKVTPSSGESGLSTIRISTMPNTTVYERTANVTVTCGLSKKNISIIQLEPNTVNAEQKALDVPAEGGTFQVKVRHNIAYTASVADDAKSWITIAVPHVPESKAMTEDVLTLEIQPNPLGEPREGNVVLASMLGNEIITVVQAGADVFALSMTSIDLPGQGGDFEVTVFGTSTYHISSMPDWITEVDAINRVHTFHASENVGDASRDGAIVFCDDGGTCLPLMVRQEGMPSWATKEFRHQSLFMRFTATWCGWCPVMNKSLHTAQQLYPGKILHLALHGDGSTLEFSHTGSLMSKYKINGFPTGLVDERIIINNSTDTENVGKAIVESVKETERVYGTVSGARIKTSIENNKLNINATIYFKEAGNFLVSALIVEDGIIKSQADYVDGDHVTYTHDCVARKFITSEDGSAVSSTNSFSTKDFQWSPEINSKWKAENLRVILFVQAKYGSREKIRSGNFGDYYVDNCFSVEAGKTLELETE